MLKMFLTGAGTGYVLGARAGREHYEKIVAAAQKAAQHPRIQQARGVTNSSGPDPAGQDAAHAAHDLPVPDPAAEDASRRSRPAAAGTAP